MMQPRRLVDLFDEPKAVIQSTSCNSIAALAASTGFLTPSRASHAPTIDPLLVNMGGVNGGGGASAIALAGSESPTLSSRSGVHQHRRSVSETTSNAISHAVSVHSGTLAESNRTQMLVLIGLYDDPSTKVTIL